MVFFAFPLLFSYMLDVVPVHLSFVIAALASLLESEAAMVRVVLAALLDI